MATLLQCICEQQQVFVKMQQQYRINTQFSECDDYLATHKLVTQHDNDDTNTVTLRLKVQQLQHALAQAKQKELKLKVVNNQLSNMLVSSSQANQRKTIEFIDRVEDIIVAKIDKLHKKSTKKLVTHTMSIFQTKKQELSIRNINVPKHEKRWSNFDTRSSARDLEKFNDKQSRPRVIQKQNRHQLMNTVEIRNRLESIKRIERQLKQVS